MRQRASRLTPPRHGGPASHRSATIAPRRAALRLVPGLVGAFLAACSPELPTPNVLLITLDTVRADRCSVNGYPRPTTPTLERLSKEGVAFDAAYAPSPVTAPSHASLFTGLYPPRHGLDRNGGRLAEAPPTLAEILEAQGYQTAGIVSSFVLNEKFGVARGFDVWMDQFEPSRSKTVRREWEGLEIPAGFDRRAYDTTHLARTWLTQKRDPARPFFLFVHYFEPHGPYAPPEPWRSRFRRDEADRHAEHYDSGIAYTDHEVGELLDRLDELRLTDDTLVIVTSDHGEGLMDHGVSAHGPQLYEEAVRVPLLIRWPRAIPAGDRRRAPVSLVDVVPTILDLLGLPPPPVLDGRSLSPALRKGAPETSAPVFLYRPPVEPRWVVDRCVSGEGWGIVEDGVKYIAADDRIEIYQLDDDPDEGNGMENHPRLASLQEQLDRFRGSAGAYPAASPSKADRLALEALGY